MTRGSGTGVPAGERSAKAAAVSPAPTTRTVAVRVRQSWVTAHPVRRRPGVTDPPAHGRCPGVRQHVVGGRAVSGHRSPSRRRLVVPPARSASGGMIFCARSVSNRSRNDRAESWKSRKPSGAALPHVGERLHLAAEVGVGVPPRGQLGRASAATSPCSLDQAGPHLVGVAHPALERLRLTRVLRSLHAEPLGDPHPHLAPAEDVAVDRVERLVARSGLGGRPDGVPAEQPGVGDVGDAAVLLGAAGEDERLAGGPADAAVDRPASRPCSSTLPRA